MMVFKRKQIVILALILMIVVAGYLQYSYKQGSSSANKETGKLGEAVYVDNQVENQGLTDADKLTVTDTKAQKAVSASKLANDFFAQAKMDREVSRSESNDSFKAIAEDMNVSKETRDKASAQMLTLVSNGEKEMRIETLINKIGFSDCVTLFGDDGSIDIVVKAPSLTTAQTAQIADIASRQAKVDIEKVHIKPLY
jgi:stage III sporulation protein AH